MIPTPANFYPVGNILVSARTPKPAFNRVVEPDYANSRPRQRSLLIADSVSAFDERVTVIGGARRVEILNRGFNRVTGAATTRYEGARWTPTVGASVRVVPAISIYGNYAEAFENGATAPAAAVNAGDILDPISSNQREVGIKAKLGDVVLTAAAFRINRASTYIDPTTRIFAADGRQVNRGLEFTAFGAPTKGLRVFGSASIIDPEITRSAGGVRDGDRVLGLVRRLASLNIDWDVPGVKGLAFNLGGFYAGPSEAGVVKFVRLPGWVRVDGAARYLFDWRGSTWRAQLNVENLFNKRAYQGTVRSASSRSRRAA